jgi:hypothetical protein
MPIALVGLPPGTVGAVAAADVGSGSGRGVSGGGDDGDGNGATVLEAIIDPLAPEASESNAPGEGIHPERRIRREQQLAAKRAAEARRAREAEERAAKAKAKASSRHGGIGIGSWLARLLRPSHWRASLSAAAAAVDSLASGEGAALGGPVEGDVVGGAPGQISPSRAKRLRASFAAAPETMTRDDLLRHCHTQLLSASMAELVDCTDSARLGLMYLTAEERAEQEERQALSEQEAEEAAEEEAAARAAAKKRRRGGWGWGKKDTEEEHEGRRTAAGVKGEEDHEAVEDAVATDRGGRRPPPKQRDAVGRAPGSERGEEKEGGGDGAGDGNQSGGGRWAVALVVWLGLLALVLQLIPYMWRRASPSLRAQIIRRVKSKGSA